MGQPSGVTTGTDTLTSATVLINSGGQTKTQSSNILSQNTYHVPLRLCFWDRLHQIPIIKGVSEERDITVLQKIKNKYYWALNPFHRWLYSPRFLSKLFSISSRDQPSKRQAWLIKHIPGWGGATNLIIAFTGNVSSLWQSATGFGSTVWGFICPYFRKSSLWDLADVEEAKVPT